MIGRPGVEVLGHREARPAGLVQRDLDLERGEHARADLGADSMHVVDASRKAVGPDDAAIARVDELDRRPPACRPATSTVPVSSSVTPSSRPISPGSDRPSRHAERRGARRDEQPAQARELRDQLVRQGLGDRRIARPASPSQRNGRTAIDGRACRFARDGRRARRHGA